MKKGKKEKNRMTAVTTRRTQKGEKIQAELPNWRTPLQGGDPDPQALRGPEAGPAPRTWRIFHPPVNLHAITQEALRLAFAFVNSHPFRVINKIGDRKLIQPGDALFMLHLTVMIDLQPLIHAN